MWEDIQFGSEYCSNGTIEFVILFNTGISFAVYILSKVTNDFSWMDRLWFILPSLYAFHYMLHPKICQGQNISQRQVLITVLILVWGTRLVFHYWRKGLYSKDGEDHRMTYLKAKFSPLKQELMLIFFIALYQPFISAWMVSPVYLVSDDPLNMADYVVAVVAVGILVFQLVADEQHNSYFEEKKRYQKTGKLSAAAEKYRKGFFTEGLFRYSRHPNYFSEQVFWWCIFLFSMFDQGINLSVLAPIQITLFFITSANLTEEISCTKYPKYKEYQKGVSKLIPSPFSTYKEAKTN